ncbi:alpha-tocopherol transfer protein-like [Bemisia tabaci]|uniref:alpha-tocopherol transfer protein-like n=1 Tax=Bemisia tabaci TaxID=7038 RepID=UPI003B28A037
MDDAPTPSAERIREDVQHLKDWISKEPHLPNIKDEKWLRTYLHTNKYSLEKTKRKLENLYTLRTRLPHILKKRDPTDPEVSQGKKGIVTFVSDKVTKTGGTMYYVKFGDPSLLNVVDFTKRVFMIADALHLEHPNLNYFEAFVDCDGLQAQHILKLSLGAGLMAEIFNKAYSERVRAIHLINAPSSMHLVVDMLRRYFPEKIGERIQAHRQSCVSFGEEVDTDVLCCDFGGKGSSLTQLEEYTLLEKHREWFIQQDDLCADESLWRKNDDQVEELRGSFRKLEVD